MRSYNLNEIENQHGQYIAYIVNLVGPTELSRFEQLHTQFKLPWRSDTFLNSQQQEVTVLSLKGKDYFGLQVFNHLGELVGSIEEIFESDGPFPSRVDLEEVLKEFGHL